MLRTFTIEIDRSHAARLASAFSHIVSLTAPGYAKSVVDMLADGRNDDAAFDLMTQTADLYAARAIAELLANTDGPILITNDPESLGSNGSWDVPNDRRLGRAGTAHDAEICWSIVGRPHIAVGAYIAESFLRTVIACGPSNCDPAAVARDRVSGRINRLSTNP